MKTLVDHLANYATYHRDQRNIVTHFIGIPMIVLAVAILLSRPGFSVWGVWLSPSALLSVLLSGYYLRLDLRFGVLMALLLGLSTWAGAETAGLSQGVWLGTGVGLFVLGWIIQFVGHYYEGRKPAFVDDIVGLAIGPLFVAAEAVFLLGFRKDIEQAIVERAGPVCIKPHKGAA